MEISRITPYPLTFSTTGLTPSTDYLVAIMNNYSQDLSEIPVTSDINGDISTPLPDYYSRYDDSYLFEVYEDVGSNVRGDLVWTDSVEIVRPYVDVTTLADTEDEWEELAQYESLARSIINSITTGFYYTRKTFEANGMGNDFIYVPYRVNKIIRVWENSILVYDAEPTDVDWSNIIDYYITPDRSAITQNLTLYTAYNKWQWSPQKERVVGSDSFAEYTPLETQDPFLESAAEFPRGYDYMITVDIGWPVIPEEIKRAATMLINDLKCNNLPYLNAYVKEYESDQYKLKFGDGAFKDTGNALVDLILAKYKPSITNLGVL